MTPRLRPPVTSFLLIFLLLAPAALTGCRTRSKDQVEVDERLEILEELIEVAGDLGEGEEDQETARREVLAWIDELRLEWSPALRAALVRAAPLVSKADDRPRMRALCLEVLREDENVFVRAECVQSLIRLGGEEAVAGLRSALIEREERTGLLMERSAEVRAIAARGLGDLNRREAAPALILGLQDPVVWVRHQSELSLSRLAGGRVAKSPEGWARWFDSGAR